MALLDALPTRPAAVHDALLHDPASALDPMLTRRSAGTLLEPGPSPTELDAILQAAATVPDHARLRPWRLVVAEGDARLAFGEVLARTVAEHRPDVPEAVLAKVRAKATAAPLLVGLASHCDRTSRLPAWEQVASASCVGYALVLAAHHLGLGAVWKSVPYDRSAALAELFDMGPDDRFLGWVNIGRLPGDHDRSPRPPVDLAGIVRRLPSPTG